MYADWRVAFHHDPCQPSPNYGILSRVAPPCALCSPLWSISPSWLEVERRCSVDLVEYGVTGRRCSRLRHSQARDRKQCGFGVAAHIRDWDVSVITPGPPIVKLPWILCAPGYVRNLPWVVLMDEVSPSKKLGA